MPCDRETDDGLSASNRHSTKMDEYLIEERREFGKTHRILM
jgi:hypothetical protein